MDSEIERTTSRSAIVSIAIMIFERLQAEAEKGISDRRTLMRLWGYVQGTNAWELGTEEACARLNSADTSFAYWCYYTVLAGEICSAVKLAAERLNIVLPEPRKIVES